MSTKLDTSVLSRNLLLQISVVVTITVAPYFIYQPWAISVLCGVLILWRVGLTLREAAVPSRWVLLPIALVGVGLTFAAFDNILGKQPGLALLALFLPLKLLETRKHRDARAALLLACFLLMGQFLNEQTLWIGVFTACGTIGVIASLVRLQRPNCDVKRATRTALILLGQGVPMMVVLFLLFPRIDGPLWGLPLDAYGGMMGLSERMEPGSISNLVTSGEIAFRAEFKGRVPPPALRYWRGPVLTHFNGKEWRANWVSAQEDPEYANTGLAYEYMLTLEPHNQRWLLALDFPEATSPIGHITRDYSLVSKAPIRTRQRYTLRSYPQTQIGLDEDSLMIAAALQLPRGSNPRTQALGQKIKQENTSPEKRIASVLDFMRQSRLIYTLIPPLLGEDSVDEFLFDTKRGFCEHFSAAFVLLTRATGLPARVVTGYQGGEINPVDGTLVVRQSDAHAWAEVWIAGRGWVRVDPTAASFPTRIDGGLTSALPRDETLPLSMRANFELLRNMRYRWEALTNAWNQWVIGYNARRQLDFLRSIGLPRADWQTLIFLMTSLCGAWMLWLAWRAWPRTKRRDMLDSAWYELCKKLARAGLPRYSWEAPTDYADRISKSNPLLGKIVQPLAEQYATLRFGRSESTQTDQIQTDIDAFSQAIKQLQT